MSQYRRTAVLWCLAMVSITAATAQTVVTHQIVAPNSLRELITQADSIVTGTADATVVGDIASATITVEKVLKGSLQSGSLITATWTTSNPPAASASSRIHGLFYLRHTSDGRGWTLLPVVLGAGWFNTVERTPVAVPTEISAAVAASLPTNSLVADKVAAELIVAVESGSTLMAFRDLLSAAREIPSPVFSAAFRRFANGSNPSLICTGVAGVLAAGDAAIPAAIRANYKTWSSLAGWSAVLQELRTSYVTADPQALAALGALATDQQVPLDLRTAAATALAVIHAPQILPTLAHLLDDPSPAVEAAAVGGLAMFANNVPVRGYEPAPGPWKYRSDDTIAHSAFDEGIMRQRGPYYIQFWKGWWSQHQLEFTP